MNFPRIKSVQALPGYQLSIRFADGRDILVPCKDLISGPIFGSLSDPMSFQKVRIGESGETIYWDIPVPKMERPELSGDALYLRSLDPQAAHQFEALVKNGTPWKKAAQTVMQQYAPVSADALRVSEPGRREKR